MTENRWGRLSVLAMFCCTLLFGEPSFYIFLFAVLGVHLAKPQAYLGLLFFSGLIKNAPIIKQLPIDVTLLSLVLFVVYFSVQRIRSRTINKNIIAVTALLVSSIFIVGISLLTTPAPWSYLSKSGIFIVALYLPLVVMIIQLPGDEVKKNIGHLLNLSVCIGYLWVGMGLHNALVGYAPPQQEDPTATVSHLSAFGEDYMTFSSFIVLIFLEAIIQFFFRKSYAVSSVLIIVLAYAVLNSPARGLTLGLMLATFILVSIFLWKPTWEKIAVAISLPIGLILFTLLYFNVFSPSEESHSVDRLTNFDPSGVSIGHRLTSIRVGWEHWKDQIFFGTGVDSIAFFNENPGYHAHNPFLEIIFEYGLLGGLPLLFFIVLALFLHYRFLKTQIRTGFSLEDLWLTGAFITFFVFGMFSGSLGDMRPLWILLGIVVATGISPVQRSVEPEADQSADR